MTETTRSSRRGTRFLVGLIAAVLFGTGLGVVGPMAEPASAASCSSKVFKKGDRGWCVKQAQILLRGWSYHAGQGYYTRHLPTHGKFGSKVRKAVLKYQRASGVGGNTGRLNKRTWKHLCNPGFGGGGGDADAWTRAWAKARKAAC